MLWHKYQRMLGCQWSWWKVNRVLILADRGILDKLRDCSLPKDCPYSLVAPFVISLLLGTILPWRYTRMPYRNMMNGLFKCGIVFFTYWLESFLQWWVSFLDVARFVNTFSLLFQHHRAINDIISTSMLQMQEMLPANKVFPKLIGHPHCSLQNAFAPCPW